MTDILAWLEGSSLGHALRGAGVWTYAVVNLGHILGVAALFGSVLVLDLRLIGVWKRLPLGVLRRPIVPVAAGGFLLAAVSGICMLATNGTEYAGNPFLAIKFPAIAVGLANVAVLGRLPGWQQHGERELTPHEQTQLKVTGAVSLASWFTAIAAGRMIGYW